MNVFPTSLNYNYLIIYLFSSNNNVSVELKEIEQKCSLFSILYTTEEFVLYIYFFFAIYSP